MSNSCFSWKKKKVKNSVKNTTNQTKTLWNFDPYEFSDETHINQSCISCRMNNPDEILILNGKTRTLSTTDEKHMKLRWHFDEYEWYGYLGVGAAAVTRDEPRRWRMNHDGDRWIMTVTCVLGFDRKRGMNLLLLPFGSIWVQLIILFFKTVQLITDPQNTIRFWTFIHRFSLISVQFSSVQQFGSVFGFFVHP